MDDLAEILIELTDKVYSITNQAKKNNKIVYSKISYIVDDFSKFDYDVKTGHIACSYSTKNIFEDEPDWYHLSQFHEKNIESLSEFSKAQTILSEIKKVHENQAKFWLSNFTKSLMKKTIDGLSKTKLSMSTISFIREIEGVEITWYPEIWLEGLIVTDKEIQIKKNMILKQPTKDNMSRKDSSQLSLGSSFRDFPSAILLLKIKAKSQNDIQKNISKKLTVLRLFKVGSILNLKTKMKSDSVTGLGGGTSYSSSRLSTFISYSISKKDISTLKEFLEKIEPLIPSEDNSTDSKIDHTVIAIQRYHDALLKPEIPESRLSFAIMCLEALYLKDHERQELEHRLGQRVSKLLGEFEFQSLEVYNKLKRSYEIRSSFVHGSPISMENREEANDLAHELLEFARLSIVIQLQLKKIMEKDQFLNLIDNSLLNQKATEKFQKLLEKNCKFH